MARHNAANMNLGNISSSSFIIPALVLALGFAMFSWERRTPGRTWPIVAGWWGRALFLNVIQFSGVLAAGFGWNRWMSHHTVFSIQSVGTAMSAVIGYLTITFFFYWWHRWRHEFDFLWRWLHQIHHSPQRLEVLTSFYKHPAEIMLDSIFSSAILYVILGVTPQAAAEAVLLSGLGEMFYHWNIRTPYWLGYIFQRPESHCIHHQEGVHAFNYSDLPLWDILFGTFRNPRRWNGNCGFYSGAEQRLSEMLVGVDINKNKPHATAAKAGG
jgi:sterol desaturase/sphingolipid hydroxylase (fatty acid hydroxylase superfamily)